MNRVAHKQAGALLIFSAITFWLSWLLMPDQGTADTRHILTIVQQNRSSVYASVIIQIISSVAYIPALFLLAAGMEKPGKMALAGAVLLAIGAMGMCADAFFHLLAFFMTDAFITIQADIINLMTFMQTKGILLLIPLLLPFFIGSLLLALGLRRQQYISRIPQIVFMLAFATGILGAIIVNKFLGYGRPTLVLAVLGLFAAGQIITGLEIIRKRNS